MRVYLARRRRCLAGRTASLAVLWWRPVAVSWLTDGGSKQRRCCFKRRRERVFLFHSPLVFSFFFLCFVYQRSPLSSRFCFVFVSNFPPGFKPFLPSLYFGSSLFRFVLSSLRFVLFSHVFLFFSSAFFLFSPSFSFFFCVLALPLFIEPKERGSLLLRMGSRAVPVGWLVGLPWFLIIKGRGASSLGRAHGKRETQQN